MATKPKPATEFAVGDKVSFKTAHAIGSGELIAIRAPGRGPRYHVKVGDGSRWVHASQLKPAK